MKKYFYLILFVACHVFHFSCGKSAKENNNVSNSSSGNTGSGIPTSQDNYKKYCVSCHGSDGKLGMAGAKDLTTSVQTQQEREFIIRNGKGSMPAFPAGKMTDEEVKAVAEYTFTLK